MKLPKRPKDRKGTTLLLANEESANGAFVFGLPNSLDAATDENGWTVLPFGEWLHAAGYQRFQRPQAEQIVAHFRSIGGKLKRAFIGTPIFRGHPDNPAMANEYPDKTEYGQISDMEVRPDGLAIRHILSNAGAALATKFGLDRISPNWYVRDTGEEKNGLKVYEPTSIRSMGLVKRPNIPNLSLVNEKESSTMKNRLVTLLTLANEATEDQIVAAVENLSKRPEPTALANAKDELAVANAKVVKLEADLAEANKRADAGAVALANERKSKIADKIDEAVKSGRITKADAPAWTKMLETDFEAGSRILANSKPALKTEPRVKTETLAEADAHAREEFARGGPKELGNDDGADEEADGNNMAANAKLRQKLVNDEMKSLGCTADTPAAMRNGLRNKAWANVKKGHPHLFEPTGVGASTQKAQS